MAPNYKFQINLYKQLIKSDFSKVIHIENIYIDNETYDFLQDSYIKYDLGKLYEKKNNRTKLIKTKTSEYIIPRFGFNVAEVRFEDNSKFAKKESEIEWNNREIKTEYKPIPIWEKPIFTNWIQKETGYFRNYIFYLDHKYINTDPIKTFTYLKNKQDLISNTNLKNVISCLFYTYKKYSKEDQQTFRNFINQNIKNLNQDKISFIEVLEKLSEKLLQIYVSALFDYLINDEIILSGFNRTEPFNNLDREFVFRKKLEELINKFINIQLYEYQKLGSNFRSVFATIDFTKIKKRFNLNSESNFDFRIYTSIIFLEIPIFQEWIFLKVFDFFNILPKNKFFYSLYDLSILDEIKMTDFSSTYSKPELNYLNPINYYRIDSRPPEIIFKEGFAPRNINKNLLLNNLISHLKEGSAGWVSLTSKNALKFIMYKFKYESVSELYIYEIDSIKVNTKNNPISILGVLLNFFKQRFFYLQLLHKNLGYTILPITEYERPKLMFIDQEDIKLFSEYDPESNYGIKKKVNIDYIKNNYLNYYEKNKKRLEFLYLDKFPEIIKVKIEKKEYYEKISNFYFNTFVKGYFDLPILNNAISEDEFIVSTPIDSTNIISSYKIDLDYYYENIFLIDDKVNNPEYINE